MAPFVRMDGCDSADFRDSGCYYRYYDAPEWTKMDFTDVKPSGWGDDDEDCGPDEPWWYPDEEEDPEKEIVPSDSSTDEEVDAGPDLVNPFAVESSESCTVKIGGGIDINPIPQVQKEGGEI